MSLETLGHRSRFDVSEIVSKTLERVAERAGEQFSSADRAAMRNPGEKLDESTRDWIRRCEQAMNDAYAALDAFDAAHPELVTS